MLNNIIILFTIIPIFLSAKQRELDSLLIQLKKHTSNDSVKVELLNNIAKNYDLLSNDSCLNYANQALALADKIKYNRGIGLAYTHIGSFYVNKGEYQKALKIL